MGDLNSPTFADIIAALRYRHKCRATLTLSIKFFAYFRDREELCTQARYPSPRTRAEREGRVDPSPALPPNSGGEMAPDWFWAVIVIGCVAYLLLASGVVKIRSR